MKQDPVSPALLLHGCHALWVLSPSSRGAGPPAEVGGSVEAALRSCKVTSFHSEHPGPIGHTADPAGGSGAAKARLGWGGDPVLHPQALVAAARGRQSRVAPLTARDGRVLAPGPGPADNHPACLPAHRPSQPLLQGSEPCVGPWPPSRGLDQFCP